LLRRDGAELVVADIAPEAAATVAAEFDAQPVDPAEIHMADVDVYAPCARGAVLNDRTIPELRASIVAGAANNQLAEDRHGADLVGRGILYAPDYVINAGGIINVSIEVEGAYDEARAKKKVENIYLALKRVFEIAKEQNISTNEASNHVAEERLAKGRRDAGAPA